MAYKARKMQPLKATNRMTPYPHLEKSNLQRKESAHLYSKNNLSALRKLTLPTTRNAYPFLKSQKNKPQTDRKKSKTNSQFKNRIISTHSNFHKKKQQNKNITRNELFRERHSEPGNQDSTKLQKEFKAFKKRSLLNQRTNHSLYSSGKNLNFPKGVRMTGTSLGAKDSLNSNSSPKYNPLNSDFGKLKNNLERKISRDNAKFLKEFDKFGKTTTQNKYLKPKLKLVQKQGQSGFGIKAFPKNSLCHNSNERFSLDPMNAFSQNTTSSNTLKQLEKVRVFDVRSKWFKPKKSLNYSEKVESKKSFRAVNKIKNNLKKNKKIAKKGLMLSLIHI